jgi:hypothetical protein
MQDTKAVRGSPPTTAAQALVCRLRRKDVIGRRGPVANMAEVELENVSGTPLDIAYWMTELHHLNLLVRDAEGKVVSQGHFGDRFAPTREPSILHLEPGEKFTAYVHLFATMRVDPVPPGTYAVEAVYEYNGLRAVSEPVQVTVSTPYVG